MVCKGPRGRSFPLNATARYCIEKMLEFNKSRGFSVAPAAPLFQNSKHGPLSVRSIQLLIKGYREKSDLESRRRYRFGLCAPLPIHCATLTPPFSRIQALRSGPSSKVSVIFTSALQKGISALGRWKWNGITPGSGCSASLPAPSARAFLGFGARGYAEACCCWERLRGPQSVRA